MTPRPSRLALQVVVPQPPGSGRVELRPLVDGRDVVPEAFSEGPCTDPGDLLVAERPLMPVREPREVRLAMALCAEECCGALYVTVRREGTYVAWGGWRNPRGKRPVDLPGFWFDAEQYRAEVERATNDTHWEWPARTVARLLDARLRGASEWRERWECQLGWVWAYPSDPGGVDVVFYHPRYPPTPLRDPWLQFRLRLAISGEEPPAAQAERLAAALTAVDPREEARVCGGSAEYAEQLGYPWPPVRNR